MKKSIVLTGFLIQSMICEDSKSSNPDKAINHNNKRLIFPHLKLRLNLLVDQKPEIYRHYMKDKI